jgi:hypothetical protein
MTRPNAFSTDEAYANAWGSRCHTLHRAHVSYRYHRKRQRFFDLLDKGTKALTVVAGASLLADPIKQNLPAAAMVISGLGLLSLVYGFGDRKQAHKELAEAFTMLASKIEGTPAASLTAQLSAGWEADALTLDAKEPPQLRALVSICEREQAIAEGHPDHVPALPLHKRVLSGWLSFG